MPIADIETILGGNLNPRRMHSATVHAHDSRSQHRHLRPSGRTAIVETFAFCDHLKDDRAYRNVGQIVERDPYLCLATESPSLRGSSGCARARAVECKAENEIDCKVSEKDETELGEEVKVVHDACNRYQRREIHRRDPLDIGSECLTPNAAGHETEYLKTQIKTRNQAKRDTTETTNKRWQTHVGPIEEIT